MRRNRRSRRLPLGPLAAALALVLVPVPVLPAAVAAPVDQVVNGGFETGATAPWVEYPAGSADVVTASGGQGAPAAGTRFAALPAGASLAQTVTGLKPSQDYLVTAQLRKATDLSALYVGLRYYDAQHPNVVEEEKAYAAGTQWARVALPFRTDATHTQVNILAKSLDAVASGSGYLDDVRLIELSAARVDISTDTERARAVAEGDGTAAQWAELQAALSAADAAYWDFGAADAAVTAAATRLALALAAYDEAPPGGIVSPGDTAYYVSSSTGDDAADGLSPESAWRSLDKINASTFAAGDSVLLRGGDTWEGTTLRPRGSGTQDAPITLGAFGAEGERPHLNSGDDELVLPIFDLVKGENPGVVDAVKRFHATVYLADAEHWVIRDLDVSNHSPGFADPNGDGKLRSGIMIMNDNAGTLRGIDVLDNYVHDVLGSRSEKTYWGGAGIIYTTMLKDPDVTFGSNYEDILIEGNYVRNTNRQGIATNSRQNLRLDIDHLGELESAVERGISPWFPSQDVVIRDNYVKDVSGDGILPQVAEGALVERNTVDGFNLRSGGASAGIWAWNADDTVFQFNEAFGGNTTQDGQGYDVDYGQTGTIYQYNYSHDNDGGFMLICSPGQGSNESGPGHGVRTQDAVIRYNVSQNDRARVFMFSGYSDGTQIYNNTVYQGPGVSARPVDFWAWNDTYPTSAEFYNNIFQLDSAAIWNDEDSGYSMQNVVFDSNTIYGQHTAGEPDDPNKSTADPLLTAPGTGTTNTPVGGSYAAPSLSGYTLRPGSPAAGAGRVVETTSGMTIGGKAPNGGRDLWGSPVVPGQAPNRGADNAPVASQTG